MFHRTINRLSLTLAAGLAMTACNVEDSNEPVDDTLETQLSQLEAENEEAAIRRHGLPEGAGEEAAEGERMPPEGERGERMPPEGEREGPEPGVDPAEFCAENLDAVIEQCEARAAEAEELPEDFPGCEAIAEEVCLQRAARAIRHRIRACHQDCRPEARAVFGMCAEDGGEPEACREEAMGVAEACHEACPDAPERPEGEAGERPERGEGDEGERPERGEGDDAERPERPAPEDGEAGERPERPAPEDGERPERPAPEDGDEGEGDEG